MITHRIKNEINDAVVYFLIQNISLLKIQYHYF